MTAEQGGSIHEDVSSKRINKFIESALEKGLTGQFVREVSIFNDVTGLVGGQLSMESISSKRACVYEAVLGPFVNISSIEAPKDTAEDLLEKILPITMQKISETSQAE